MDSNRGQFQASGGNGKRQQAAAVFPASAGVFHCDGFIGGLLSLVTSAAGAAGTAAGAVPSAGGFPCDLIADHASDQQSCHRDNDRNEDDIDKIDGKPGKHRITSFRNGGSVERKESFGDRSALPEQEVLLYGEFLGFFVGFEELP